MSVKIRLRRTGKKKQPMFRLVATDSRMPRDGRFLEVLGWYRPIDKPAKVKIDIPKTIEWLKRGAVPSDTVNALFHHSGLSLIWDKVQKGENIADLALNETITERPHKVKAKARARMTEKAAAGAAETPAA